MFGSLISCKDLILNSFIFHSTQVWSYGNTRCLHKNHHLLIDPSVSCSWKVHWTEGREDTFNVSNKNCQHLNLSCNFHKCNMKDYYNIYYLWYFCITLSTQYTQCLHIQWIHFSLLKVSIGTFIKSFYSPTFHLRSDYKTLDKYEPRSVVMLSELFLTASFLLYLAS